MSIYSPSQTKLFMECPRKWQINRLEGWSRKWLRKSDVAAMVGQVTGKVLTETTWDDPTDAPRLTQQADDAFQQLMNQRAEQGYIIEDEVWQRYDSLRQPMLKVITKYLQSPARIPQTWSDLQYEYNVGDGANHNAYIDVCGVEPDGSHFIWDFKCKMYLKTTDQASEMLSYRQDWQMLHYGWFYWQKTGVLPSRYYIGMPVLGPTPAFVGGNDPQGLGTFAYTQSDLERWHESAVTWWSLMDQCIEAGDAPMSAQHTGRYGNCEFYDACFTYHNNLDMMQSAYIQVTRER